MFLTRLGCYDTKRKQGSLEDRKRRRKTEDGEETNSLDVVTAHQGELKKYHVQKRERHG